MRNETNIHPSLPIFILYFLVRLGPGNAQLIEDGINDHLPLDNEPGHHGLQRRKRGRKWISNLCVIP
jgi:hypothetical protein